MNDKIREHVKKHGIAQGYDVSEDGLIEIIRDCSTHIWTGDFSDRRHWQDCFTVVELDGMLIGFDDARTTGDESPRDKGWEFDPESICEVKTVEVTTTEYKRVA